MSVIGFYGQVCKVLRQGKSYALILAEASNAARTSAICGRREVDLA